MQESVAYLQQGGGISCLRLSLPLLRFSAACPLFLRNLFLSGKVPEGFSEEDFLKNLDFCVGIVYAYIQLCGFTKKCMTGSEELVSAAAYAASDHCREKRLS